MAELKDKSWEIVQQKAFTAWMNETLSQRNANLRVDDLYELADGVKLATFLEILSNKKVPTKIELKPVNRIQKIQNCSIALKFLESDLGVKNPGCSAEDVVNVEIKLILGLLWTLYRKYRIAIITHQDKSSEEGLLLWCKNVTSDYQGVSIENFKQSFRDGLAFLALVHRFSPETTGVQFDKYSKDNPEANLNAAFEFAEKELHIPKLLDANEVMDGRVDERSLVLYTSLFFHAYTAAQVKNDLEKARLSTEEVLFQEREKNKLLLQAKAELEAQIEDLTIQLRQLKDSENAKIEQLKLEIRQKEEINLALQSKLSESSEETLKFKSDSEKKQAADAEHIQELKKKHVIFEEEIESLKNDIDNFKIQLDNERKDKEDQLRVLSERTEQDGVHRKGLGVLRRNLDQHIEDLHTWQKYLDSKDKVFLDFEHEIRSGLVGELDAASDFVEELNILSGKLENENEAMLKILKQKQGEAKAEEIAKAQK